MFLLLPFCSFHITWLVSFPYFLFLPVLSLCHFIIPLPSFSFFLLRPSYIHSYYRISFHVISLSFSRSFYFQSFCHFIWFCFTIPLLFVCLLSLLNLHFISSIYLLVSTPTFQSSRSFHHPILSLSLALSFNHPALPLPVPFSFSPRRLTLPFSISRQRGGSLRDSHGEGAGVCIKGRLRQDLLQLLTERRRLSLQPQVV